MDVVLFANTLTNKMHQRDEFTFVANAAFLTVSGGFDDVDYDSWYFADVDAAAAAGLMGGTTETTFSPDSTVSRETVATVLYRAAGSPAVTGDELAAFADAGKISGWAKDAVLWAVQEGVLAGSDGAVRPGDPITREQLAVMFWRYAQYMKYDVSVGEDTNILSYADAGQVGRVRRFRLPVGHRLRRDRRYGRQAGSLRYRLPGAAGRHAAASPGREAVSGAGKRLTAR